MRQLTILKNQLGFSIIELLASILIFTLILSTSVVTFNAWKKREQLREGAIEVELAIRKVQIMSLAPEEIGGSIPLGGYGIFFDLDNPSYYILFADADGNYVYDVGIDPIIESLTLPENIAINNLTPKDAGDALTIIFKPPLARAYINQSTTTYDSAVCEIIHNVLLDTTQVELQRVTGQIRTQ